jgi:penicillin-binding protein 1A
MRKKFFIVIWVGFFLTIFSICLAFVGVIKGWIGYMPDIEDLQNPISRYASQVFSEDGKLLGTWSRNENRVFSDYDQISPHVFNALIATEDERFFEHSGVDVKALIRAVVKRGIFQQTSAGGGSTITQQLAKQLYSNRAENTMERLMQKPIEWVIAVELERCYTKEEILTLYLNYFDFLYNAVGIKTAARVYFDKLPSELTILEAATLIGMCKNPSLYNPVRDNERCRQRRNVVLGQMVRSGYITQAQCDELKQEPLTLKFKRSDHKEGLATYLREHLRTKMTAREPKRENYKSWQENVFYQDSVAWANDPLYGWCNKNKKKNGEPYDIYVDGLRIYTTIDSRLQAYAEAAMNEHVGQSLQKDFEHGRNHPNFPYSNSLPKAKAEELLQRAMRQSEHYRLMKEEGASEEEIQKVFSTPVEMTVFTHQGLKDTVLTPMDSIKYYKKFLRSGLVSIDPSNGHVKAYVGGLNYTYFQYDMAFNGRRQVGSTMKPFVYAMAMEDGMHPQDTIWNLQRTYKVGTKEWTPRNGSKSRYGEPVTLKWGLSQSNNWITAELMYQSDPEGVRLVKYLREYGVVNKEITPAIALCLGTGDITVGEMASAYTAFVNKGIRCAPILVSRIEDAEGNVIAEFAPRLNEVISEESSYKMLDMMKAVIDGGTGQRLRYRYGFKADIAGKTGTTNSNSDGWFVGCVPRLVTACWVGGEERDIHFLSTAMGQGAALALPVWALYMKKVYEDESLGYSQDETFTIKVPKYERIEDEDFDIIEDSQTPSEGEIIEDVDSYFD